MDFIDMHCDSLSVLLFTDAKKADLYHAESTMVDIERMKRGGQLAQFFAVFLPFQGAYEMFGVSPLTDEEYIETLRQYLLKNVQQHQDLIEMAYSAADIEKNKKNKKMSAVLTMEDGRAIDGKLENIKHFYDMGFRAISLTWNQPNCIGSPNSNLPEVMMKGLTQFGKEAVTYMQELGILVDVSHLSEGGFYDVASICKRPFVATHSNSRALCPHSRNLSDEQIKMLGNAGGVTGLNFGPEFLNEDISCKDSTVECMVKHISHIVRVGGVECVALGSDFDGIDGNLEISDCTKVNLLEPALKKAGFGNKDIEKIFFKNVLRVMKDTMR